MYSAWSFALCTSSLYYDALISATYLGKALKKDREQIKSYRDKATELYKNMFPAG